MRSSNSQPLPPLNSQAGELSQWTDVLASHLGYLRSIAELYNLPLAPPSIILEVALEHHLDPKTKQRQQHESQVYNAKAGDRIVMF